MILTRHGNKRRVAKKIIPYFVEHDYYIEPFFGAGGMFFSKEKAKHNLLNDNDEEVANLYFVIRNHSAELYKAIDDLFIHQSIFNYWIKNQEEEMIMKAVRFLMLSNSSLYGSMSTFKISVSENPKKLILERIESVKNGLKDCQFSCLDFKKIIKSGARKVNKNKVLFYCDPPYQNTKANYNGFVEQDFIDLVELLIDSKANFAISEFDSENVLKIAEKYNLTVTIIGERKNIGNIRTEILITNYPLNEAANKLY